MAPQLPGTILVIDDEDSFVRALTRLLRRDGYRVDTARNGRRALTQLQARPYDVIPTATFIFDMRATTPYVPPAYLVYPQEATYVTSLPDQWGRMYHSHV